MRLFVCFDCTLWCFGRGLLLLLLLLFLSVVIVVFVCCYCCFLLIIIRSISRRFRSKQKSCENDKSLYDDLTFLAPFNFCLNENVLIQANPLPFARFFSFSVSRWMCTTVRPTPVSSQRSRLFAIHQHDTPIRKKNCISVAAFTPSFILLSSFSF